jgi:hypothetical protein
MGEDVNRVLYLFLSLLKNKAMLLVINRDMIAFMNDGFFTIAAYPIIPNTPKNSISCEIVSYQ